jgi:predicted nicotinamide N-methyase
MLNAYVAPGQAGLDELHLTKVPLVPGIRLHLACDAIVLWARMEAAAGRTLPAPFWASAWPGGQALARYVVEHPGTVAGYRVLDLASGSGMVGIAAAMAGAASVTANDVDPYALAAIRFNALANGVVVEVCEGDLLDGDGGDAEVVLAGDVFYNTSMAERVLRFLDRVSARGGRVLVGDPRRDCFPRDRFEVLATYRMCVDEAFEDSELKNTDVLRPRNR